MVQVREFWNVMPMSVDEYHIAQMHMVMKIQQQSTSSSEGVEVLENRPFQDTVLGKGQYTSKVYRLQSKLPAWLTTFAAADALHMHEEAWNAYPRCKTGAWFKQRASGSQASGIIDIASSVKDYWSFLVGTTNVNLSKFKSLRTDRGPLLEGWQDLETASAILPLKLPPTGLHHSQHSFYVHLLLYRGHLGIWKIGEMSDVDFGKQLQLSPRCLS